MIKFPWLFSSEVQPPSARAASPGRQPCSCSLDSLISRLPTRILQELAPPDLAALLHSTCAQKLVLQEGRRIQVVPSTGSDLRKLPQAQVTHQDLVEIAAELGLSGGTGMCTAMQPVNGGIHRVSIGYSVQMRIESCLAHMQTLKFFLGCPYFEVNMGLSLPSKHGALPPFFFLFLIPWLLEMPDVRTRSPFISGGCCQESATQYAGSFKQGAASSLGPAAVVRPLGPK